MIRNVTIVRWGSLPAALASVVLLGAGCGEDRSEETQAALLFHRAGCADCHAFAAAGARGRAGPDLDAAQPTYDDVVRQMTLGGAGMPSFADRLTESQAAVLATFVANETGRQLDAGDVQTAARFTPDDTRISDCRLDFSCLEQAFGNLAFEHGPRRALDELQRAEARNAGVGADCHRIAHMVGAAALARSPGRVGEAFAEGSAICSSGYYHGIAERAFSDAPSGRLGAVARSLCADPRIRRTSFLAYQCVHGLGHGLMIFTGYDLPRSLRTCDRLRTAWDRLSCSGGVFMENISSSYGVESRWLRDDDPIYPCHVVARRHKLYCYLMVTSRILRLVGYDFTKTARACRRSEPDWVDECFQSLGRDASGHSQGGSTEILEICLKAGEGARDCLYGAARGLANTDAATPRAATLCSRAPSGLRGDCFRGIGTIVRELYATDAERTRGCASVSSLGRLRAACRLGAGVAG